MHAETSLLTLKSPLVAFAAPGAVASNAYPVATVSTLRLLNEATPAAFVPAWVVLPGVRCPGAESGKSIVIGDPGGGRFPQVSLAETVTGVTLAGLLESRETGVASLARPGLGVNDENVSVMAPSATVQRACLFEDRGIRGVAYLQETSALGPERRHRRRADAVRPCEPTVGRCCPCHRRHGCRESGRCPEVSGHRRPDLIVGLDVVAAVIRGDRGVEGDARRLLRSARRR